MNVKRNFQDLLVFISLILGISFSACTGGQNGVQQEKWGDVDGKEVYLYTLENSSGMEISLTNYGGIITSILVPDKDGKMEDVVLGFDNLQQYLDPNPCFGATIGRVANRIKDSKFKIDGIEYLLEKNDGEQCLHGGNEFDRVVWDSEVITGEEGKAIRFHYVSKDGSNGFPGKLDVFATYTLTEDNAVHVHFEAETDKATHVNMTQHSYFNLTAAKETILGHHIKIDADSYTEIDEDIVPTGVISTVIGTDWDLTNMTQMGENMFKLDYNGYHYCYILNKPEGVLKDVVEVIESNSGRTLTVSTTQPGVHLYTGNAISEELTGKYGIQYGPHMAFCLETEHFPNSPNKSNFPSTLVRPGEKYDEIVIYKFGIAEE